MKIAMIGWGSLIWSPRELPRRGAWLRGGPVLPVEFSRISPDGRLTLAIDTVCGVPVDTWWTLSARDDLDEATADLARREDCEESWIGFVELASGNRSSRRHWRQVDVSGDVLDWCDKRGCDAAVWTALPVTFAQRAGRPFTVANALTYLRSLTGELRESALTYVRSAPVEVDTPLRRAFARDPELSR
ncbi:MAG: hypothetical protein OEQ13_02885 [Acidobacteriota bacterium]|nr:hypothetical protein [Acidobacteriota bacterium]